jgi:hypothetical protein
MTPSAAHREPDHFHPLLLVLRHLFAFNDVYVCVFAQTAALRLAIEFCTTIIVNAAAL